MARLDEQRIFAVLELHRQGMKGRAIARALHISRNTVRQIVCEHEQARQTPHSVLPSVERARRASKLDPFRPQIEELLRLYPDITAQRVFESLREKSFEGGYSVVKDLVRRLRPKKTPAASLQSAPRLPGEMAECDWSPYRVIFTHAPAAIVQVFGYTLRYSTRKFYSVHESNDLHALMDGHRHAFARFGGAAQRCKYDSQKPVVLRWCELPSSRYHLQAAASAVGALPRGPRRLDQRRPDRLRRHALPGALFACPASAFRTRTRGSGAASRSRRRCARQRAARRWPIAATTVPICAARQPPDLPSQHPPRSGCAPRVSGLPEISKGAAAPARNHRRPRAQGRPSPCHSHPSPAPAILPVFASRADIATLASAAGQEVDGSLSFLRPEENRPTGTSCNPKWITTTAASGSVPGRRRWIQKVPQLLDEVHRLIEQTRLRFALTGSSARKLRRGGVNLLAGRALTQTMHPFTNVELGRDFDLARAVKFGMLPSVWVEENPAAFLKSYVSTYLREEVQQEGLTRNLAAFSRFLEAASFSQAAVLNVSAVARDCHVERKVVEDYFTILEDLLLAVRLPVFSRKAKRRLITHRKFFFFDAGVFRAVRPRGPLDSAEDVEGPAIETLVFQHLRALNDLLGREFEMFFWRTADHLEVDFVLYGERGLKAVEVKRAAGSAGRISPPSAPSLKTTRWRMRPWYILGSARTTRARYGSARWPISWTKSRSGFEGRACFPSVRNGKRAGRYAIGYP